MRGSAKLFLMVLMIALSACYSSRHGSIAPLMSGSPAPAAPAAAGAESDLGAPIVRNSGNISSAPRSSIALPVDAFSVQAGQQGQQQQGTLDSGAAAQAFMRKVIQNAEMTIETDKPSEGQQKIGVIAEKHGGFVVISESKHNDAASQNVASTLVNVVVRVPAQKFQTALDEIRAVGGRILHEKSSGQDVTEEYIDLEARIRTKKALEAQFLEIMKQARKISDAMEVQTQLAEVRTEIERLEGRRRFLENQSALSTINITLHTPTPVVAAATRGFVYDLKAAFGDGMDTGAGIFLGIIQFVIVMIPVMLFIVIPAWLVFKWLRKRIPWPVKAATVSVTDPGE
ncbi:MAG TPA: DUF4349 domain-containing protein [Blastocatellia bacterium]|jgi:hypothetical protein